MTRVLAARSATEGTEVAREAASLLLAGELVVYPTDTFYALGADPYQAAAVEKVFRVKDRSHCYPLPLILAEPEGLGDLGIAADEEANRLIEAFWPGPLTLVFRAPPGFPTAPLAGGSTVALRVPACALARRIAAEASVPIVATSANRSSSPPSRSIEEAQEAFASEVALYVDSGTLAEREGPSTLVDVSVRPFRLVRAGIVPWAAIEATLGRRNR